MSMWTYHIWIFTAGFCVLYIQRSYFCNAVCQVIPYSSNLFSPNYQKAELSEIKMPQKESHNQGSRMCQQAGLETAAVRVRSGTGVCQFQVISRSSGNSRRRIWVWPAVAKGARASPQTVQGSEEGERSSAQVATRTMNHCSQLALTPTQNTFYSPVLSCSPTFPGLGPPEAC